MTGQLAFDLPPLAALRRADFFPSPSNAAALAAVDDWQGWPGGRLMLIGPEGSGKTHLAHVWADQAGAVMVSAAALDRADLPGLAARGAVAVEDGAALAGQRAGETALFHLCNLMAVQGGRLLITAHAAPGRWGVTLPDLLSRLQAIPVAEIAAPDDALLSAVLVKLFADRQIAVPPNLVSYLLPRMPRSLGAARDLVAALDARALAQGRPVTRALAADMLDSGAAE